MADGLQEELDRKIDDFADHDWGEYSPNDWIVMHALTVSSGAQAIDWISRNAEACSRPKT